MYFFSFVCFRYLTKMLLKLTALVAICTAVTVVLAEEQPKYGGNFEPSNQDYLSRLVSSDTENAGSVSFNETNSADAVIDTILQSGRQGRNLDGFDEVYSDPTVQEALQKGDDRQARNIIKDKLCSLGLMECESEQIEGKRPFLPPGELIYSQPPPGYRPPNGAYGPARPMQPPHGNKYNGPPNKYNGPPRKVGYSGSPFPVNGPSIQNRPLYVESKPPGPFYEGPSPPGPIYQGASRPGAGTIYEGPKPPGPIYEDNSSPYKFDSSSSNNYHEKYETVQDFHGAPKPSIQNDAAGSAASSVNIHHHYHHLDSDAAKGPAVVVNPIPVSQGASFVSSNSLSSASEFSGAGGFSPVSGGYNHNIKQEFQGVNSGLGGVNGISNGNGIYGGASSSYKPIIENGNSLIGGSGPGGYDGSLNSFGGNNGGGSFAGNTQFGQSASGAYSTQDSFHSQNPGYYKKALNTNGGPNSLSSYSQASYNKYQGQSNGGQFNQFGQSGSGVGSGQFSSNSGQFGGQFNAGENYQGFDRQGNSDCVCVPYEQCPSQDVIGRKDDLILPLDPRNLMSDIEALDDEIIVKTDGNGTMQTVRVSKEANKKDDKNDDTSKEEKKSDEKKDEVKKISKREVESEKKSDEPLDQADGEAVSSKNFFFFLIICTASY